MSNTSLIRNIDNIRELTINEREDAKKKARLLFAGRKPEERTTKVTQKHPGYVVTTIRVICIIVLFAAFLISAVRLGAAGYSAMLLATDNIYIAHFAGFLTMLIAEFGLMASVLALSTNNTKNSERLLYFGAILSMSIALIGNITQAKIDGWFWEHPFESLDSVAPTLIALVMAYILKQQFLDGIEHTYKIKVEYDANTRAWEDRVNSAELSDTWPRNYAIALRETIYKVNNRSARGREALNKLNKEDWQLLIRREMAADEWFITPAANIIDASKLEQTEPEYQANTSENYSNAEEHEIEKEQIIRSDVVSKDGINFGHIELRSNGKRYAICDVENCVWTGEGYTETQNAEKALHRHYTHRHVKYNNSILRDYQQEL